VIEVIRELGKRSLENRSVVEGLTLPVPKELKGKKQHVVQINFNLNEQKIDLSIYEVTDETPLKYVWVGNADGSNSPQWYGTTSNAEYLLNQTIPNLLTRWPKDDPFYEKLQHALNLFFMEVNIKKTTDNRYKYVVRPDFFNGQLTVNDAKKAKGEITKIFHLFLKNQYSYSANDIALYTLAIDEELVVHHPVYHQLILAEKESVFENASEGICSVTNTRDQLTGTMTKLQFKYYVNDKLNFASGLNEKNFTKNMAVGRKAYTDIMAGEAYIQRNLDTRFGRLSCYIIPSFLYEPKDERISVDRWSRAIQKLAHTANTLEEAASIDRFISHEIRRFDHMNRVALHFLFYVKSQSSFKVAKLIQDVPMIQVHHMVKTIQNLSDLAQQYLGQGPWKLGLNTIYYLIPMKEMRGENQEKRKILSVYEALLSNKPLDYQWLISQIVHLARIYHFEQFTSFQINKPKRGDADLALIRVNLQSQLLYRLLLQLNCLKGVKTVASVDVQIKDAQMAAYIGHMEYNHAQASMFLLGALIASVAVEQQKKLSNKAILGKINFQGMNKNKVQILSNDVFEKLRQYKVLNPINEEIFAEHKRLFDASLQSWPLSDREAVFFLLSGYAFKTNQIINSKKVKAEAGVP
jgi:CRISPR-associated protein Csh1